MATDNIYSEEEKENVFVAEILPKYPYLVHLVSTPHTIQEGRVLSWWMQGSVLKVYVCVREVHIWKL